MGNTNVLPCHDVWDDGKRRRLGIWQRVRATKERKVPRRYHFYAGQQRGTGVRGCTLSASVRMTVRTHMQRSRNSTEVCTVLRAAVAITAAGQSIRSKTSQEPSPTRRCTALARRLLMDPVPAARS